MFVAESTGTNAQGLYHVTNSVQMKSPGGLQVDSTLAAAASNFNLICQTKGDRIIVKLTTPANLLVQKADFHLN